MTTSKTSSHVDGKSSSKSAVAIDLTGTEDHTAASQTSRQSSKAQIRHRASVACASCRERRIRCVVPEGAAECTQCKRAGTECIIKNDDERRRPISKAYMTSLASRISMLEGMLKEKGVEPPPAVHPPRTRHEAQARQQEEAARQQSQSEQGQSEQGQSEQGQSEDEHHITESSITVATPKPEKETASSTEYHSPTLKMEALATPELHNEPPGFEQFESFFADSLVYQPLEEEVSQWRDMEDKKEDVFARLLSTKAGLTRDQYSGILRFFGPTANYHLQADSLPCAQVREPPEQVRRAERVIRSFTNSTHDYLMDCFWDHYNTIFRVVDRAAFEAGRDVDDPSMYSSLLHITVLAAGYRFADRDREDVGKIAVGNWESALQREAKFMLDIEVERPGGIPSVQAFLILADLEFGVGRDSTGWMYSGMANRLAFDIGLHVECSSDSIPEAEVQVRRQLMTACLLFDRCWALLLSRPTNIKMRDVGIKMAKGSSLLSPVDLTGLGTTTSKATDDQVHGQLVDLMELAGRITDNIAAVSPNNSPAGDAEDKAYLRLLALDGQLQKWYHALPEHLTWKPANIKTAPFSFFLLHQQYHTCMILLHRPWAKSDTTLSDFNIDGQQQSIVSDQRALLARKICTQHAIRISQIFWQHRQRFDGRKISFTAYHHAGTAAVALIAALAHPSGTGTDRQNLHKFLELLLAAISDMSVAYQPALRMHGLLRTMLVTVVSGNANSAFGIVDLSKAFAPTGAMLNSCSVLFGNDPQWSVGAALNFPDRAGSSTLPPSRRQSDADIVDEMQSARKRRRVSPSLASRRASMFTPSPPLSVCSSSVGSQHQPSYLTPPRSSHGEKMFGGITSRTTHPCSPFLDLLAGSAIIDLDFETAEKNSCDEAVMSVPGPLPIATPPSSEEDLDLSILDPPTNKSDGHSPAPQQQPANEGGADQEEDVDMTIAEWLASPSTCLPPKSTTTTTTTTTSTTAITVATPDPGSVPSVTVQSPSPIAGSPAPSFSAPISISGSGSGSGSGAGAGSGSGSPPSIYSGSRFTPDKTMSMSPGGSAKRQKRVSFNDGKFNDGEGNKTCITGGLTAMMDWMANEVGLPAVDTTPAPPSPPLSLNELVQSVVKETSTSNGRSTTRNFELDFLSI